jgi:hypothetical protein
MLYRQIIALCSEIHRKHTNTLCGQKLAVHKVILGLCKVNVLNVEYIRIDELSFSLNAENSADFTNSQSFRCVTSCRPACVADSSKYLSVCLGILPTNERLAAIHLTPTTACSRCGDTDTVLHRISRCQVGPLIWTWTKARIAAILRVPSPTHTRRVDNTPNIPLLATIETGSFSVDCCTSGNLPTLDPATPISS